MSKTKPLEILKNMALLFCFIMICISFVGFELGHGRWECIEFNSEEMYQYIGNKSQFSINDIGDYSKWELINETSCVKEAWIRESKK